LELASLCCALSTMMRSAILASSVFAVEGAHYAVLVAGSNTYSNYRHQADVCHAYQIVKGQGIPEENIIVMAYDDIANNARNPFPGKIFNKPTEAGEAGVDVYAGCKIDYKGKDVTPANFMAVLDGTATGKKLTSTSEDNVFVFFSDHGAPGLIAFPTGQGQLHKADLQSTFDTMHSKNMYKKLVFYLETCESGSMFQGMTTPGVYALSASNPTESSWGYYCSSSTGGSSVNGKNIGSCLGDLFSIAWMEDSDAVDITSETLDAQFNSVHTRTSKSEVMQWGDMSFKTDKVSDFQGTTGSAATVQSSAPVVDAWATRQIDLRMAYENYVEATTSEERLARGAELQAVISEQLEVEAAYERFLEIVYPGQEDKKEAARQGTAPADQKDCELATRQSFIDYGKFDSWTGFSLGFHKFIVNTCADVAATGSNIDLAQAAKQACTSPTVV